MASKIQSSIAQFKSAVLSGLKVCEVLFFGHQYMPSAMTGLESSGSVDIAHLQCMLCLL